MTYFIIAILIALFMYFLLSFNFNKKLKDLTSEFTLKEKQILEEKNSLDKEKSILEASNKLLESKEKELHSLLEKERIKVLEQSAELAQIQTENKNVLQQLDTQKIETENLQKKLTSEFENIANKILKERAQEFSTYSEKNIKDILTPLKEQIHLFENKVSEAYDKELRDKTSLRTELERLMDLNTRLGEEANNLTKALKGDVKMQGNWGEVFLERVLERSGLVEGQEYVREEVIEGVDGSAQRPDVIIYLPDEKHLLIDSKVSLVAYERFVNAKTEEEKNKYMKEHILSVRTHINGLSDKKYQQALNLNTPDFVLLFLPIESSFSLVIKEDIELFSYAWDKKIVLVSPTTLLATLKTVSSIWKQENQTRNSREIAKLSGDLYDKLVGFVEDLEKVKNSISRAGETYDTAMKKLQSGRGNVFRTAEKIKSLGAKASKSLPSELMD